MSKTLVNFFVVVVMTTILDRTVAVQIPDTDLFTDTNYQISGVSETGFSILTYASVYTNSGELFVQLDDHQDRESKYAPGGSWFRDGLWTFKLAFTTGEAYVTIHHVLYPGYKLIVDSNSNVSPGDVAPKKTYVILSTKTYEYGHEFYDNGVWLIRQESNATGTYRLQNLGTQRYAIPIRYGNDYYKWVSDESDEVGQYTYKFEAV